MTANSTTVALIALISTVPCGVGSAQQGACVSKRAGSVPAAFAAIVARERTLVCERLATRIPGVQVAVAVNGKLVWSEGFGYADAERKKPVTRETQFRIGSVSKPLTASFRAARNRTIVTARGATASRPRWTTATSGREAGSCRLPRT